MIQSKARWGLYVLLALTVAAFAAQAKSNFTGEWKMLPGKSEFGPLPPPQSITQKIEHKDPDLKVSSTQVTDQGEFKAETKFTTDGKECTNEVRGNPMKSTVTWDGDNLKFKSKLNFQGNDVDISDTWVLGEGGKTMTVSRHFASSQGEFDAKIVYEKQ